MLPSISLSAATSKSGGRTGNSIREGDIVLVRAGEGFRLHRLVDIRSGWLVTRGDNHAKDDPPEPVDRLLGVAVRIGKRCR